MRPVRQRAKVLFPQPDGPLTKTVEDAALQGMTAVDFLGDSAPWKASLGTRKQKHVTVCLFRRMNVRCQICRVIELQLKPLGRRIRLNRLAHRLQPAQEESAESLRA